MTRPDPIIRPFIPLTPSAISPRDPSRWIEAVALTRMRLTGLHETVMAENERMKARVFAVAAE